MITGALLLDKGRIINYQKALRKYAWRMTVVLLTIGSIFALMEEVFDAKTINVEVLNNVVLDVLTANGWEHMWYLYMLIGLYLVLPFIKASIHYLDIKSVDYFISFLFLFTSVVPMLSEYLNVTLGIRFPMASEYLLYLILGWRITVADYDVYNTQMISKALLSVTLFVSLILGFMPYFEYVYGVESLKWLAAYNSPFEVVLGISIFGLAFLNREKLNGLSKYKLIQICDKNSFGIYIFHMLWINVLYKIIHITPISVGWWSYILFCGAIFIMSVITTALYRKLPIVGKYV